MAQRQPSPSIAGVQSRLKLFIILAATVVVGGLIWFHVDGINGPSYWRWPWRISRGVMPYLILFLVAIPTFVAQIRFAPPRNTWPGLLLMMGTVLGMEIVNRGLDLQSFDLTRVATIIEEPGTTGYFTHAVELVESGRSVRAFLKDYVRLMPGLTLHARNKPPGSILFYVPFVRWGATENGAALGAGLFIALLATLSVPATYLLIVEFTGNPSAAFAGAACLSLFPGLVLFLPEFDQFYIAYTCALLIFWSKALTEGRVRYAVLFGLVFAFVCFQTFNFLVLGFFVAGYAALTVAYERHRPRLVIRQGAVAAGVVVGVYGLLWIWCGYNPVAALQTGIANHQQDMPGTHRVWPYTVPFDLTDFILGTGWVGALLAGFYFLGRRRGREAWLVALCLAQPVVVALSGQLQGETARVWGFMFPLVAVAAGLELAEWTPGPRIAALWCLWALAALLSQNMVFV